jgi:hypothetical protein
MFLAITGQPRMGWLPWKAAQGIMHGQKISPAKPHPSGLAVCAFGLVRRRILAGANAGLLAFATFSAFILRGLITGMFKNIKTAKTRAR